MKHWFCLLICLISTGAGATEPAAGPLLVYNNSKFRIPSGFTQIASSGSRDGFLAFSSRSNGHRKFLAFYNLEEDKFLHAGCAPKVLFESIFENKPATGCDEEKAETLREVYLNERDAGTWRLENLTVYYSIGEPTSFLFAFGRPGKSTGIDTNFLSKSELMQVVGASD